MIIKKYIFFPLWKIEVLEKKLSEMEQKGYRLENIKFSYCFFFKKSTPKEMNYFLSYKSFRGQSMSYADYALESRHYANLIKSKMCFFNLYRTKEQKEKLSLLYEARLDYIKRILLEKALTSFFITIIFTNLFFLSLMKAWLAIALAVISACLTTYYMIGYNKQKIKCKNYIIK